MGAISAEHLEAVENALRRILELQAEHTPIPIRIQCRSLP
jgi:hypothetical protein